MPARLHALASLLLILTSATSAATVTRYEEVKDWPNLPADIQLGETAGVAVDLNGHVFVFHRPGRGFALKETTKLTEPTVLEIDPDTGKLISSWGANMFLVPHGITIDSQNNVFLTDVSLQQVFKFTHDGKLIFALGEPRVGAWDATHFNEPTDIAIGEIHFAQHSYANSANNFRETLNGDFDPKWTEVWAHINLGKIFDVTNQRDRALNEYRLALRTIDNTRGAQEGAAKYIETPYRPN